MSMGHLFLTTNHASVRGCGMSQEPLVSVILATYNEADNIEEMLGRIFASVRAPMEVILVDDDSPDLTWKIAQDLNDDRIHVIRRRGQRGLASAYVRGIMESRGEILSWLDSDLSIPPESIPGMIDALQNLDVVVGSRYVAGGDDIRPAFRVWTSKAVNAVARTILGNDVQDYDSGFVVLRREVLDHVTIHPRGYGEYFFELIHSAIKSGLRVGEVGYVFTDRVAGESKSAPDMGTFLLTGAQYVFRICQVRVRNLRRD